MIITTSDPEFKQLIAENDFRPIVLTCGCFDVLTVGHIRHLKAAARPGYILVVLVTKDKYVYKSCRPVFSESLRAEMVDSLRCVEVTIINPYPTAVEMIKEIRPQVYVKGKEYKENYTLPLDAEVKAMSAVNGKVEFTDTQEMHTTDVIRLLKE